MQPLATSKESCLPVCRHQAEPHAQIQKSIDRIGDGTETSDQSVAVLHHFKLSDTSGGKHPESLHQLIVRSRCLWHIITQTRQVSGIYRA